MGRKRTGLVKQREGSSNWYCNFTVKGQRFRECLGTDDKDTAEILAAEMRKNALLGNLTKKKPEMTLTEALARYWLEHGQHLPSAASVKSQARVLLEGFGESIRLSQITKDALAMYVAARRAGKITTETTRARAARARSASHH